jgi:hypothetical protein
MKILKDESGQAAILVATFMAILALGFMALAFDGGYFFRQKRMAQAAADAAAIAAAEEASAGNTSNMQSVANAIAKMNGFNSSATLNPATVQINNPPVYGQYAGTAGYVEVIVSKSVPTLLLGAFNHNITSMTVTGRAVAGGGQSAPTCVCLEGPSGMGLNMSNDAQLNATNCGVTVDSSSSNAVGVVGSASINALSLGTVSTIAAPTLPTGITCYANPVQGYIASNNYTGVYTLPIAGETATSGTICYTSMDTSNAASVTFTPGYTYYIQGGFTTGGGAPVTSTSAEFYVGGTIDIANGVTMNMSAPTVNGSPGTLFYAAGSTVTIQGGSNSNFSGLIYAPNAAVTLNNGTGTTTNMDFVAQSLTMAGGAALNSYASTNLGTMNSSVAKMAE